MFIKFFVFVLSLAHFSQAIPLTINNQAATEVVLTFSSTNEVVTVPAASIISHAVATGYNGIVTIKNAGTALVNTGTRILLNVGTLASTALVDITSGFTLPAAIETKTSQGTTCSISSCTIDLQTQCAASSQIRNPAGVVIGCAYNAQLPLLCPRAFASLPTLVGTCSLPAEIILTIS